MTVTIQEGIDASALREAIYETLRAGMEADADRARKLHQARMELIRKGGGAGLPPLPAEQGSLFE
jgi:hypothetical protein